MASCIIFSEIPGLERYHSPVFLDEDYSPAAIAVRWQGYFAGPTGFPHGELECRP
jgi:hypothetical protein